MVNLAQIVFASSIKAFWIASAAAALYLTGVKPINRACGKKSKTNRAQILHC